MLTTHYLDEADTMAERVVIIDHGRVIVVYGFAAALLTAAVGLWVGVRAMRTATL